MARCHLVVVLAAIHLCLALAFPGGFEYNPALIPQAQGYYPSQYSQPNPYAQQQYPPNYYPPNAGGYYYPPNGGYQQPGSEEDIFLQDGEYQTPEGTGAPDPTPTGPSATVADTAVVQTPDETADSTGSSSPPANSNMDPLDIQLAAALEAVKADMISKGKQVLEEKQWTDDVKAVIEQYTKKISNVYINVEKLKKDMGDLYRKKQQIINAQIQKSLTQKLKDSKSDLQTVQAALDKVTNTQMEFEQSKKDIQATIDSIFAQLSELKGDKPAAATGTAEGAEGAAEGEEGKKEGEEAPKEEEAAGASSEEGGEEESDIVDRTAEINQKIDTIKSIVSALNGKGASSSE